MDTSTGFFAQADGEWSDAFAPPQQLRTQPRKAWERAPVPAHAPRLQGQKIWKRGGLRSSRSQNNANKENIDAAQAELERDGNGARKKARMVLEVKGKDADVEYEEVVVDGVSVMVVSPKKTDRERDLEGGIENGALVVPRKRTNANHLVTPRRGARRTALETVGSELKGGLGLTGQGSRQSPRMILLNDVVEGGMREGEKPVRRRKSMRKSGMRRLTVSSVEEDSIILTGSSTEVPNVAGVIAPMIEVAAEIQEISAKEASVETVAEENVSLMAEVGQETFQMATTEATVLETGSSEITELLVQDESIVPVESSVEGNTAQEEALSSETQTHVNESANEEDSPAVSSLKDHDNSAKAAKMEEIKVDTISMELEISQTTEPEVPQMAISNVEDVSNATPTRTSILATIGENDTESNENQSNLKTLVSSEPFVFISVEGPANPASPTKVPATPRRGKRSAPPPLSVRRSTRSTRTSTIIPDECDLKDHFVVNEPNPIKASSGEQPVLEKLVKGGPGKLTEIPEISTSEVENVEIESIPDVTNSAEVTSEAILPGLSVEPKMENNSALELIHSPPSDLSQIIDTSEEERGAGEGNLEVKEEAGSDDVRLSIGQPEDEDTTGALEVVSSETLTDNDREDSEEVATEEADSVSSSSESVLEDETITQNLDFSEAYFAEETITRDLELSASGTDVGREFFSDDEEMLLSNQLMGPTDIDSKSDDTSEEGLEDFGPVSIATVSESMLENATMELDTLLESSTPDPSTTALVEAISENAPSVKYDDDTDLLRNFLTRVKANKEAKAKSTTTKRKRSLPHSPIHLPLGSEPSSPQSKIDFDVSLPAPSPTKRRKRSESSTSKDDITEPQSIRRSGRTRLPVKSSSLPAPSFIPVRRLGQDGDNTITLRKNEDKELATLTKINTRKNKGSALSAVDVLGKMGMQKEDPASRHQALKQKFDEKTGAQKSKKKKSVVWAEEIAQYQSLEEEQHVGLGDEKKDMTVKEKKKEITVAVISKEKKEISAPVVMKEKKSIPVRATSSSSSSSSTAQATEDKKTPVVVGVRSSRISMGMVANGTPAPRRKVRAAKRA